ncbi:MAG: hypothetical protein IRY90_13755 [Actinomadura rubrobrunea]|nr:hypothetical protein [Actinomadura rubrobrunea]
MSTWRQALKDKYGAEAEQQLKALGTDVLDDDTHDTIIRRQWLDAAREYRPDAALKEELQIRLIGSTVETGALGFEIVKKLLGPLRMAIAPTTKKDLGLRLVGLSAGGTILLVQAAPTRPRSDTDPLLSDTGSSPADVAIRHFIRLIDTAESEGDIREWYSALKHLYKLVDVLDEFDLSMALRWLSRTGAVRSSRLTRRGRSHVRALQAVHTKKERKTISGRITELHKSGHVKIKSDFSYSVDVAWDTLNDMHLELDQEVSFIVEATTTSDKFGVKESHAYEFVEGGPSTVPLFRLRRSAADRPEP